MPTTQSRRSFLKFSLMLGAAPLLFGGLTGCPSDAQGWVETLEADMPTITQIVGTTLSVVATAEGAGVISPMVQSTVQMAFQLISSGLQTLDQVLQDYKTNPSATLVQKIQIAVQDVLQHTNAILAIAMPDQPLAQVIAAAVSSIVSVVSAALSLIPTNKATRVSKPAFVPKSGDLKKNFNAVLVASGYGAHRLT